MRLTVISFIVVFLISGCVHTVKPTSPDATDFKEVKLKNYSIGTKSTVSVGESLIRVKNYTAVELRSSMQATSDFNLSGGLSDAAVNVNGRKGQKFDIVAEVEANGKNIKAIKMPGSRFFFGIYSDGKFSGIAASFNYMRSPVKGLNVYKVTPEHTRFIPVKTMHVLEDYPYENMEIIYSGMSGGGIHLLYREYSIKDLIRPAFTQELIYPTDSKSIRFKKYKIKIRNITPEIFTYTVVEE